jgi:hypothetical protein
MIPPPSVNIVFAIKKRTVETRNIAEKKAEQKIEKFMQDFVGMARS